MAPARRRHQPAQRRSRARSRAAIGAVASAFAAFAAAAAPSVPASGRYAATLCVSQAAQAPNCGPAEVDVRPGGHVRVQVSDIVYRLRVVSGQAAVVVTQGAMQIDEFDSGAEWSGAALRFADAEKRVHYEVQIGPPRRVTK